MRIVEFYTPKNIISSPYDRERASTPRIGDLVQYTENDDKHHTAIIESINTQARTATIVYGFYAPYMHDGYLSVSGGPFKSVPLDALEPTLTLQPVRFWHWGDNLPGGDMACHFYLDRPVFNLKQS